MNETYKLLLCGYETPDKKKILPKWMLWIFMFEWQSPSEMYLQ